MNYRTIVFSLVIFLALGLVVVWKLSLITPRNPVTFPSNRTVSDGVVTISYPSNTFGLATNQTQVVTHSYIPPCSEGFKYCLYYIASDYQGTNFESAGVGIKPRLDLGIERLCLDTPPTGFDASIKPAKESSGEHSSSSVFSPIGDAGAGHFATGNLYRLFVRDKNSCYEFETRIGQTQFANYPAGAIKEFTTDDQKTLEVELNNIINAISLTSGTTNLFPKL